VPIDEADGVIKETARENEACRRLVAIPRVGPVTATAIIAAIGNGAAFRTGREFAAWLGGNPRRTSNPGASKNSRIEPSIRMVPGEWSERIASPLYECFTRFSTK
jgi:transposase